MYNICINACINHLYKYSNPISPPSLTNYRSRYRRITYLSSPRLHLFVKFNNPRFVSRCSRSNTRYITQTHSTQFLLLLRNLNSVKVYVISTR